MTITFAPRRGGLTYAVDGSAVHKDMTSEQMFALARDIFDAATDTLREENRIAKQRVDDLIDQIGALRAAADRTAVDDPEWRP